MSKSRSIINSLPIQDFNLVLDRFGLEKAWYSVLATHLNNLDRADLKYIVSESAFKNYRNPIKHGRSVNEVDKRNGEASVLWLENILK